MKFKQIVILAAMAFFSITAIADVDTCSDKCREAHKQCKANGGSNFKCNAALRVCTQSCTAE